MPPIVRTVLDKTMQDARFYIVTYVRNDEFSVKDGYAIFVVKLREHL